MTDEKQESFLPSDGSAVRVLVTGAAGNIGYSVVFPIGQGRLFGNNQKIDLVLLDIPQMVNKMDGVVMELKDCAFPLINSITATADYSVAFKDIDFALLIGARPRGKGMLRSDLLKANASIFEGQGKAIEQYSKKTIKVCVVGNPANTNCLITSSNAPSIPKENFSAMTRLDQNRSKSQIADKIGTKVTNINNVIIWGNHSKTQYPDINHSFVNNYPQSGITSSVKAVINDDKWIENEFVTTVQQRGSKVIEKRGLSSAGSAANACLDHVRTWVLGTKDGEMTSMAVYSDGSYDIPKDIIYSFPVTCNNGTYQIVQNLPIDDRSRKLMDVTANELLEEKREALGK